jgi:hypothetical protein
MIERNIDHRLCRLQSLFDSRLTPFDARLLGEAMPSRSFSAKAGPAEPQADGMQAGLRMNGFKTIIHAAFSACPQSLISALINRFCHKKQENGLLPIRPSTLSLWERAGVRVGEAIRRFALQGMIASMLLPAFALADAPDVASSSRWQFQAGPAYRTGTRIRADWHGEAVTARIAHRFTRHTAEPGTLPPLTGYADRDYADGFVYRFPGTGDPDSDAPDHTWFWGYETADQYDGSSVAFRTDPGSNQRTAGVPTDPWAESERIASPGLDFSAMRRVRQWGRFGLGVAFGARWFTEQAAHFEVSRVVARETRETFRYVDRYEAPYLPFPNAHYAGDSEGPGYLIPNMPDSRQVETLSHSSRNWVATSALTVDVSQFDLRLGPTFSVDLSERVALRLTPQARVAHVETEARAYTVVEPTVVGPIAFESRRRERDWIWGGGVEAEISMIIYRGWRFNLAAAADRWNDTVNLNADPFDAEIELGVFTFSATIGRGF